MILRDYKPLNLRRTVGENMFLQPGLARGTVKPVCWLRHGISQNLAGQRVNPHGIYFAFQADFASFLF